MSRSTEGVKKRLSQIIRSPNADEASRRSARVTAFLARFIVLREGRRSRAHRIIENFEWDSETTAEDLASAIRGAFVQNGDKLGPVNRDIRRALEHADYSADYFESQFSERVFLTFQDALIDYEKSNRLLFDEGSEEAPRTGGWRLPAEKELS